MSWDERCGILRPCVWILEFGQWLGIIIRDDYHDNLRLNSKLLYDSYPLLNGIRNDDLMRPTSRLCAHSLH